MRYRCSNINEIGYHRYGGRGIVICKRWNNFDNFFLDMGNPPTGNHSIDRINNDGNYDPSNCRWATHKEQQNNMRSNKILSFNAKNRTMKQWAEDTGIAYYVLKTRLLRGWYVERALTQSVSNKKRGVMV